MMPTKIAFALPVYWPAVGGCEYLTHELAHVLSSKKEIGVRVITQITDQRKKVQAPLWYNTTRHAEGKGRSYWENRVEVRVLGLNKIERRILYPFVRYHHRFERLSVRVIVETFRRQFQEAADSIDLIHCIHNGVSYYGLLSLRVARENGVPFVFSPTLHLYHEGWHDAMMEAIREGKEFRYLPRLNLRPRGYHDRFWVELCHQADALVTWTAFESDFLVGLGVPREKIFPLKLGPVLPGARSETGIVEKCGIEDHVPVILFLGRNHELKGIEDLLLAARRVWNQLPETRFLFVGPLEGKAGEIFQEHRDRRVIVIDEVSGAEKAELLERCDIFCVPSLHESFGIVFLEAWYYRKPIMAADIPPIRELNPDGRGGLLIRPIPDEIASGILKLLNDPALREEMGRWGKDRVDSLYRWDSAGDRLIGIYSDLLGKRRR